MKEVFCFVRASLILAMLCLVSNAVAVNPGQFTANEIIAKAVERTKNKHCEQDTYAFTKTTVREERDSQGQVKERKHKSDQIIFRNGDYFNTGRVDVSDPVEIEENDLAELENRKPNKRKDYLDLLTPELVGKYTFSLLSHTTANGRSVYEISFQPRKKRLPASDLKERVMNQATGTLWIDDSEFELVRARIYLNSEISVGGFLGALKRAAFSLERVRLESGVWFERFYKTDYEARKLAQVKRVTTQSECGNFRRINNG
ncbi:MAG: hypothetical protein H0X66_05875 [Verrucomicrobia bacterium]|nr:hypothetical protein [Verrucomicrobiota bacterium]